MRRYLQNPYISSMSGVILLVIACLMALSQGRYPLPTGEVGRFVLSYTGLTHLSADRFAFLHNLIVDIRLPRIIAAILVGASLSASGSAYQAIFRNPLVSPSIMGVLAGAAAGAALAIILDGNWLAIQISAFGFGMLGVSIAILIAQIFGRNSIVMLILGGIVSSALFSSLLNLLKYAADPDNQLPTIVYWMMGNLAQASLHDLKWAAPPMIVGVGILCMLGRALDAMSMGDDEARSLGVPAPAIRLIVIAVATLISALTVSIAGMIGWIGMIVPHITRMIVGPSNSRLIPASAWIGAIFLLFADSLARNLFTAEIPIGIITELLGIPVFIFVLARVRKGWSS